jgi:hypothetical protein
LNKCYPVLVHRKGVANALNPQAFFSGTGLISWVFCNNDGFSYIVGLATIIVKGCKNLNFNEFLIIVVIGGGVSVIGG